MTERVIYLVTSGEYSGYQIDAVFDDRALAEAFVARFSRDSYGGRMEIEEYELNPYERAMREGWRSFSVMMYPDGAVIEVREKPLGPERWVKGNPHTGTVWCRVLARDERHAIKILNEYRVQMLAQPRAHFDDGAEAARVAALAVEPDEEGGGSDATLEPSP